MWRAYYDTIAAAKADLLNESIKSCLCESDRTRGRKESSIRKIKTAWMDDIKDFEWTSMSEGYLTRLDAVSKMYTFEEAVKIVLGYCMKRVITAMKNRRSLVCSFGMISEPTKEMKGIRIFTNLSRNILTVFSLGVHQTITQHEKLLHLSTYSYMSLASHFTSEYYILFHQFLDKSAPHLFFRDRMSNSLHLVKLPALQVIDPKEAEESFC